MKLTEIDVELERLQALRDAAVKEAEEEKKREGATEAREILGRLVTDLDRLNELGYVPPRIMSALSNAKGIFSPGLYIKRPKMR